MAGELGFEPRQTESESVVLPLHHSPIIHLRNQQVILSARRGPDGICKNLASGWRRSTRSVRGLASAREKAWCEGSREAAATGDALGVASGIGHMSANFEELDFRPTPIGVLSLRRRRQLSTGIDIYEIKLGDQFLMSSLFTAAEIA